MKKEDPALEAKLWLAVAGADKVDFPSQAESDAARAAQDAETERQVGAYQEELVAIITALEPVLAGKDGGIVVGACLTQILSIAHQLPDLRALVVDQLQIALDQVQALPQPTPVTLIVAGGGH